MELTVFTLFFASSLLEDASTLSAECGRAVQSGKGAYAAAAPALLRVESEEVKEGQGTNGVLWGRERLRSSRWWPWRPDGESCSRPTKDDAADSYARPSDGKSSRTSATTTAETTASAASA